MKITVYEVFYSPIFENDRLITETVFLNYNNQGNQIYFGLPRLQGLSTKVNEFRI